MLHSEAQFQAVAQSHAEIADKYRRLHERLTVLQDGVALIECLCANEPEPCSPAFPAQIRFVANKVLLESTSSSEERVALRNFLDKFRSKYAGYQEALEGLKKRMNMDNRKDSV